MKIWKYVWLGSWLPSSRRLHTARPKSVGCCALAKYEARWKVEFVDNRMFEFHKLYFAQGFSYSYTISARFEYGMYTQTDDTTTEASETKLKMYTVLHTINGRIRWSCLPRVSIEISMFDMETIRPKTPRFGNVNTNKPKIPSKWKRENPFRISLRWKCVCNDVFFSQWIRFFNDFSIALRHRRREQCSKMIHNCGFRSEETERGKSLVKFRCNLAEEKRQLSWYDCFGNCK